MLRLWHIIKSSKNSDAIDSSGVSDEEPSPPPPPPPAVAEVLEYEIASASSNEDCFPNDSTSEAEDCTVNENGPNRPIASYAEMCELHAVPPMRPARVASVVSIAPVVLDGPVVSSAPVASIAPIASIAPVASIPPIAAAPLPAVAPIDDVDPYELPSISDYDTATSSGYHDDYQTDTGPSDSDHDLHDFWRCARCDYRQNHKAFRFCDKCYTVRTKHFPKRPKCRKRMLRRKRGEHNPRPQRNIAGSSGASNANTPRPGSSVAIPGTSGDTSNTNDSNEDKRVKHGNNEINPNLPKATKHDSGVNSSGSCHETEMVIPASSQVSFTSNGSLGKTITATSISPSSSMASLQAASTLPLSEAPTSSSGVPIPSCSGNSGSFERNLELLSARAKRRSALNPDEDSNLSSDLCMMCSKNPKNGVFVHKTLCHICCCYTCAVKIWNERKQCPICNGKVSNVLQLYSY